MMQNKHTLLSLMSVHTDILSTFGLQSPTSQTPECQGTFEELYLEHPDEGKALAYYELPQSSFTLS